MKALLAAVIGLSALLAGGSWAGAEIIRLPVGATDAAGEAVDASADFRFTDNLLTVTISNNVSDMRSVGQAVRSLSFELTSGQTSGSLASSLATQRTIAKNGTFTDKLGQATDWKLSVVGDLFALSYTSPDFTIIGDSGADQIYNYANSSLVGNKPHNPFLLSGATFVLAIPGVTEETQVREVTFGLGTGSDAYRVIDSPLPVPEPATLGSLVGLVLGAWWMGRRGGGR